MEGSFKRVPKKEGRKKTDLIKTEITETQSFRKNQCHCKHTEFFKDSHLWRRLAICLHHVYVFGPCSRFISWSEVGSGFPMLIETWKQCFWTRRLTDVVLSSRPDFKIGLTLTRQGKTCRTRNMPSSFDWAFLLCLGSYQLKLSTHLTSLENSRLVWGRAGSEQPFNYGNCVWSFYPWQLKPFTWTFEAFLFFVCQYRKSVWTSSCFPCPSNTTSLRVTRPLGNILSDSLDKLPAPFRDAVSWHLLLRRSFYCARGSSSDSSRSVRKRQNLPR